MKYIENFFAKLPQILKDTGSNLKQDEPIVYSAAIAFFTIFSLPAILIVLTLAGSTFFAEEEVRAEIVKQMEGLISPQVGGHIGEILKNVTEIPAGFWSILIALAVVIKSATIIFFIMQKALNAVWKLRVKPDVHYLTFLKHRLVTLAIVAGLGFLLLSSLVLDALLLVFRDELYVLLEERLGSAIRLVKTAFSLLVVLVFFTSIHKILPDASINWRDALAGGVITSILFLIGKQLINYILGSIELVGIYAAAGSFVVVLLWVFYSSVILMLGAEVTKAYAHNHGREVEPSEIAEKFRQVNGERD